MGKEVIHMEMETVLILLVICSAFTALIVEALKKMFPGMKFSKNLLAGIVSVVVAAAISAGYSVLNHITATSETAVYIVILIVLSWLTAMLGYDKVKQTILQVKDNKTDRAGK